MFYNVFFDKCNLLVIKAILLSVFFINFRITSILGRGFIITELLIFLLIIINIFRKHAFQVYIYIYLIITIPLIISFEYISDISFIQSYLLFVLYYIFVILFVESTNIELVINSFLKGISILSIFGIFQFFCRLSQVSAMLNFVNNPFGNMTFSSNLKLTYFLGLPRTNSFFYEPSIFGVMCLVGVGVIYYLEDTKSILYKSVYKYLFLISTILSFSALALLGVCTILSVRIIINKTHVIIKFLLTVLGVVGIVFVFNLLSSRLLEIIRPGTSGYFRVVAPFKLMIDIFSEGKILGVGIGQSEKYILFNSPSYMFKDDFYGQHLGSTVDNVIFMIVITFGIIGLIIVILFTQYLVSKVNRYNIYLIIAFLFVTISTGGYNFVYFIIPLAILLSILKNNLRSV